MKNFLITLIVFQFLSCSEKKLISDNPLDFISDTTSISIDRKTEPYTRALQFLDGNLYWWNSNQGTINVFNLHGEKLKYTIPLEEDGPNGLGIPLGFFAIKSDSLIIPNMSYELSLINSKGNRFAKFDYNKLSKLGGVVVSMARYSSMIQTNSAGIFYFTMDDLENLSISDLNEQALQNYPPILSLDLTKDSLNYLDFKAPNSILKYKNTIDFRIGASPKALLLLHGQSSTLYEVEFSGKNYKEHQLETNLITKFSNEYYISPRMSSSVDENMRLAFRYSENFGLSFDPFNNFLYRFGWPGEEIAQDKNPLQFNSTPPFFTVSIYDGSDFSLIKEFTLPRNTYLAHHYFVDEKGLNLFPMHPENPEFNEDELVIHTFDFSSLK